MLPFDLCTSLRNGCRARLRQVAVPNTSQNKSILSLLLKHGFITSLTSGDVNDPSPTAFANAKVSDQRLWVTLKYRDHRPVLGDIQLISKPSKKIFVSHQELVRLLTGKRAQFVPPIGVGQLALLHTRKGWLDGRAAMELKTGGELVVRALPD